MSWRRLGCRLGVVVALMLYGPLASACPVCFSAKNEDNRTAFILTTAFLTFLPLTLLGGGVWWLRQRAQQQSRASRRPRRLALPKRSRAASVAPRPMLQGFEDIPPAG